METHRGRIRLWSIGRGRAGLKRDIEARPFGPGKRSYFAVSLQIAAVHYLITIKCKGKHKNSNWRKSIKYEKQFFLSDCLSILQLMHKVREEI